MKNLLLVFTENYPRGGGNRYMIDLINGIIEDFQDVMISSNPNGVYLEELERLSRPVKTLGVFFLSRTRLFIGFKDPNSLIVHLVRKGCFFLDPIFLIVNICFFLAFLLKTKPARILVCNGSYPSSQACLAMVIAARICRINVIMSIVSVPAQRGFSRHYEKILDLMVWQCVTLVLVNAYAIKNALVSFREAQDNQIMVLYNGVEDRAPEITVKGDDSKFVIGCIARMDESKGVLILFDAFSSLVKSHPELRLVLAGYGNASEELARRTEALGLQNQVQLLGHYDGDVSVLLNTFDVYVFPSLWEGFPYSIIESLRSGCVIVATKVGGVPEAITNGVEGLLIEPGSRDEIILAIEELMVNKNMRQTLARNARIKFEQELTLPKMHLRVREVFAELQGRN